MDEKNAMGTEGGFAEDFKDGGMDRLKQAERAKKFAGDRRRDGGEKRRENGENVNPISEHRLRGSQLGLAMNLVDLLSTSADERTLSGRRAVVIA